MLIGEVSARSGISVRMLRHYDKVGLVSPTGRTHGGYRQYADADVRRLFQVEGLRSLGLSLQQVAHVLDDLAFDPGPMVERMIERTRARLTQEEELLRGLLQVRAGEPAAWTDVLRTIALVRGLRAGDPSARQRLVLGLTGALDDDVAPLTEAALAEPDPNVSGALHWALARTGDTAVPALAEALGSPDAARRRQAVVALEKIGSPRALGTLAEATGHADAFVRGRAALARGARGDADAVPALVALVVEGREDVDAADALGVLAARHGCTGDVVREVAAALAHAPVEARRRLTAALAEVPGREADDVLVTLVEDPDRGVALTARALLRTRPGRGTAR
ncbi:HEAT repeat domain-containing protein [Cellulomonas wangsupingiae]|uniref:HEAT repeat domain-containing protein n=1 Tax=Cellulomonas wangsupingiae TaxID=2968085 RepID=A0ABY5K3L7_9CELL|nr:HEAT repeat domain-containing protein [Cellulomonas wangsupingiae]MCC2333795.1 HEAT repeat domain-containing protein [Cellulomonas wangsupingiae]UUI65057.1 HEAT repeat domain-containing protein [Cellulomonas wangsupingiae]